MGDGRQLVCSVLSQLPKHKAVVVSLIESDDSDSDVDSSDTGQSVFGGLEFMIKEARRTAEVTASPRVTRASIGTKNLSLNHLSACLSQASKPKPATGSEKENNPVRTPEALPDAKKAEYRQLREEIAK